MNEVDCIDVPTSDEAVNHTEIPDVGPSTSLAALVHTRHGCAPTPHLATKTLDPPFSTLHDRTGPPMPPIPPINTESPMWFTHVEFDPPHTPPPLTTAPPRQLYPPLAFKHPKLS